MPQPRLPRIRRRQETRNRIELGCELSEQPADFIGGERTLSHARLSASAVMNTPLVRNGGKRSVHLGGARSGRLLAEPPGCEHGTSSGKFMRIIVKELDDGVSPHRLKRLPVTLEIICEAGSSSGVQPDHGVLLTLQAHRHQFRQAAAADRSVAFLLAPLVHCP